MAKTNNPHTNNTNNTNGNGPHMDTKSSTNNKRAAFSSAVRSNASNSGGFDFSSAADIGLKVLVASTCGVVLYKTMQSDTK